MKGDCKALGQQAKECRRGATVQRHHASLPFYLHAALRWLSYCLKLRASLTVLQRCNASLPANLFRNLGVTTHFFVAHFVAELHVLA